MASVDNRIVQMTFDNARFEQNAKTTQETLKRLDESLAFKNGAKGLTDLEAAGRNFTMGGMGSIVDGISGKFNALGIAGTTALMNITNRAVDAGLSLVKSLTVAPIMTGLNEYETKINAIQTILTNTASKGTTLEDVNGALSELNEYADKTIYNFAEMTRNIGTFTAAGVELEPATNAIKGIANLAAGSGSTAAQASSAMYQLSQALAEGRVSLQTWNSVVNAGMGGELFQHALVKQAVELGELTQSAADMILQGDISFREALMATGGKAPLLDISTENLIATFNKFAEDPALVKAATRVRTFTMLIDTMQESVQSGWAQSWELIIGDMEESATFLTEINDAFGEIVGGQAEARNQLLKGWKALGGRDALIQSFRNIGSAIMSIVKPITDAFNSIFPSMTAFDLSSLTFQFKNFTSSLIISEETSNNLKTTFEGLFAIFDIFGKVIGAVVDIFKSLVSSILPVGDGFLSFTARVSESIIAFNDFLETSEIFKITSSTISDVLKEVSGLVVSILGGIIESIKLFVQEGADAFSNVSDLWGERFSGLTAIGEKLSIVFEFLAGIFQTIISAAKAAWNVIRNVFDNIFEKISEVFGEASFTPILDLINGGIFASLLLAVKKFFGNMGDAVEGFSKIGESITKLLGGVGDALDAFTLKVKSEALRNIATSIGILAASLLVISFIDQEKLISSLGALAGLFTELFGILTIFQKLGLGGGLQLASLGAGLIGISSAILILSFAMKNLSGLDWNGVAKGLVGMGGAMIELMGIAKLMSMLNVRGIRGASSYVIFAGALVILTKAIEPLAKLSWGELAKGLVGLGVAMLEIVAFSKLASRISISSSTSIVILASSLLILSEAVSKFGALDTKTLIQGLIGVGAVLLELAAFTRLMGNNATMILTSIGLIAVAGSMHIFASAIAKLGSMDIEILAKGLLSIGIALAEVTIAMNFLPKDSVLKAAGLVIMSGAMVVLSKAMKNFGAMSWSEIARGIVALGGSLTILAVALNFLNGAIGGAAALTIAAVGLYGLAGVMKIFGTMSWEDIAQSLVIFAGSLGVLVVAAALTSLVIPGMLALSGALLALGTAALLVGGGIALLGVGLAAIAVGGSASINLLIQAAKGLIDLLPYLFKRLGEAIVELANVVINGAPALGSAFVELIRAALNSAVEIIPMLADFVLKLVNELLSVLVTYIPSIVDKLIDLLIGIIDAIIPRVPEIIAKGAELINVILNGISNAAAGFTVDQLTLAFLELTAAFFLLSKIPISGALTAIANLGIVVGGLTVILAALGGLQQIPGLQWLISEGSNLLGEIGRGIGLFVGSIVGGFGEGMTSSMPAIATSLSEFMTNLEPFLNGLKLINEDSIKAVGSLAGMVIALTAASFLDAVSSWITGGSSIIKFGKELAEFAPNLKSYSDSVQGINPSAITASANAAKMLSEFASGVPNSGGLAGWFMGDNSLTNFAEELIAFAPALVSFASEVDGISTSSVSGAVNAAKLIADFASVVPNQGGVAAWLAGENSMIAFANDMALMGPSLKKFSDDIAGFKPASVISAANAAKTVAEMANNLPEVGGVVGWFSGEASLEAFGKELAAFGPYFAEYAASVGEINPEVITASATAAKALAEMASFLPKQGGIGEWFVGGAMSLSSFGEEIAAFAPYLKQFADDTIGISPEDVKAASIAGEAVGSLVKGLPKQGGIAEWFTGSVSLTKFGEELAAFAPYLKQFADDTVGITPNDVKGAVVAAEAVSALAKGLPEQGGVVSWFTGDNTLSVFGKELEAFGPHIAKYAEEVKDVTPDMVQGSVSAAQLIGDMVSKLPEQGGIVSWFTGDNTLSKFGEELSIFGPYIKSYADSVKGITPDDVKASVIAIDALVGVAKGIENEGGLVSLFTGDNTLGKFGENIVSIGESLVEYSNTVSNISDEAISNSLDKILELEEIANALTNIDWTSVTNFSKAMKDLGTISIENFLNEFIVETPRAEAVIYEFLFDMVRVLESNVDLFKTSAVNLMVNGLILGISEHGLRAAESMTKVIQELQRRIDEATLPTYEKVSNLISNSFAKAISDSSVVLSSSFTELLNDTLSTIKRYTERFRQSGQQLALGLKNGILDKAKEVAQAAAKLVQDALNAANNTADVNSPSRKTYWTGQMMVQGLVNALSGADARLQTNRAGSLLGQNTLDAINSSISDLPQVTITPILDLTNFNQQRALMERGFIDTERAISYAASAMRTPSNMLSSEVSQNGSGLLGGITFQQNNYSPKALTRAEIYRQTNNLLATARGAVTPT